MRFRSRRSRRRVIGRGLPVSSSMDAETFDRLRDEFNQVYDRIVKLVDFFDSDRFSELSVVDQGDLRVQVVVMRLYRDVLAQRIQRVIGRFPRRSF